MLPSEIAQIENVAEREHTYHANASMNIRHGFQDSLSTRISARVGLSEKEAEELYNLLAKGCRQDTKIDIRNAISAIPYIRSYDIFARVLFVDGGVFYCAGQSYPDEIREVRKCLR